MFCIVRQIPNIICFGKYVSNYSHIIFDFTHFKLNLKLFSVYLPELFRVIKLKRKCYIEEVKFSKIPFGLEIEGVPSPSISMPQLKCKSKKKFMIQ